MSKSVDMVDVLENFIIEKVQSFDQKTSSEEIRALAELVHATANCPRRIMRCNAGFSTDN